MNVRYLLAGLIGSAILAIALFSSMGGDTSPVHWMTFDEALVAASKSDKKILIDVYTTWCGWCKTMDSQTYGNEKVASYLNERFVSVKLNAESGNRLTYKGRTYTEREFARAFGITGYPATIFLAPNSDPITTYPGYADPDRFATVLSFIADDHYLITKFEEYRPGKE